MKIYACDLETTGLDFTTDSIICLGYYSPKSFGVLTDKTQIKQWLLDNQDSFLIWQNGKFDQKFIKKEFDLWVRNDFDTLLAASLLPEKPKSRALESLAAFYLGEPPWKEAALKQDIDTIKDYCQKDCQITYKLFEIEANILQTAGQAQFFNAYLMPLSTLLAQIEYSGISINTSKLDWLLLDNQNPTNLLKQISDLESHLYQIYYPIISEYELKKLETYKKPPCQKTIDTKIKFNFNSPDQKLWLLKNQLGFPCKDYKGKETVGKEVISEYLGDHPIIAELLSLSKLTTQYEYLSSYKTLSRQGKLHTTFNLDVTRTGRLSSKEPNLQNVDKEKSIRSIFCAEPGKKLVIGDLSQIEARLAAHFSEDPLLISTFTEGIDFYSVLACALLGLTEDPKTLKVENPDARNFGKLVGLSLLYGIGNIKLINEIKINTGKKFSYREVEQFKTSFFNRFGGLRSLRKQAYAGALQNGYVQTLFGRKVFLDTKEAEHVAVNRIIQPSASDLCAFSQFWVLQEAYNQGFKAEPLLLVHDEAIYQVEEKDAEGFAVLLKTVMEHGYKKYTDIQLKVPLGCDVVIGEDWSCKN